MAVAQSLFDQLFAGPAGSGPSNSISSTSIHTQELESVITGAPELQAPTLASPFTLSAPTFDSVLSPDADEGSPSPAVGPVAGDVGGTVTPVNNADAPKASGSMPRFPTPDAITLGFSPASDTQASPAAPTADLKPFAGVRSSSPAPTAPSNLRRETPSPPARPRRKSFASIRFRSRSVGPGDTSPASVASSSSLLMGLGLAAGSPSSPSSPEAGEATRQRRGSLSTKLSRVFNKSAHSDAPPMPSPPPAVVPPVTKPATQGKPPFGLTVNTKDLSPASSQPLRAPSPLSGRRDAHPASPVTSVHSIRPNMEAATFMHNVPTASSPITAAPRALSSSTGSRPKTAPKPLTLDALDFVGTISLPAPSSALFGAADGPYSALQSVARSVPASPIDAKPTFSIHLTQPRGPLMTSSNRSSTASFVASRPNRSSSMVSVGGLMAAAPSMLRTKSETHLPGRTGAPMLSPTSAHMSRAATVPSIAPSTVEVKAPLSKPSDASPALLEPPGLRSGPKALRRLSSLSSLPDRLAQERLAEHANSTEKGAAGRTTTASKRRSSLSYLQPLLSVGESTASRTSSSSDGFSPAVAQFPKVPSRIAEDVSPPSSAPASEDGLGNEPLVTVSASSSLENFARVLEAGFVESSDHGHSEESAPAFRRPSTRIFNLVTAALGPDPPAPVAQPELIEEESSDEEVEALLAVSSPQPVESPLSDTEFVDAPTSPPPATPEARATPSPMELVDLPPSLEPAVPLPAAPIVAAEPEAAQEEAHLHVLSSPPPPTRAPPTVPAVEDETELMDEPAVQATMSFWPELDTVSAPIQIAVSPVELSPPLPIEKDGETAAASSSESETMEILEPVKMVSHAEGLSADSHLAVDASDSDAPEKSLNSSVSSFSGAASPLFDRSRRDSTESAPVSETGHSAKSMSLGDRVGQEEIAYALPGDGRPWASSNLWAHDISLEIDEQPSSDSEDRNPINRFSGTVEESEQRHSVSDDHAGDVDEDAYSSSDLEDASGDEELEDDEAPLGEGSPAAGDVDAEDGVEQPTIASARRISKQERNPFNFQPNKMQKRDRRGNFHPLPPEPEVPSRPPSPPTETVGHPLLPQTDEHVKLRSQRSLARLAEAARASTPSLRSPVSPASPELPPFVQESILSMDEASADDTEPLAQVARKASVGKALASLTRRPPPRPSSSGNGTSQHSLPSAPPAASKQIEPLTSAPAVPRKPSATLLQPPSAARAARPEALRILFDDKERCAVVQTVDSTTVGDVLRQLDQAGHTPSEGGKAHWALFEHWQDLGIERPLREYELIGRVLASWPRSGADNKLIIKRTKASFARLCSTQRTPQTHDTPIGHFVRIETKRGKWEKRWLSLDDLAVASAKSEKGKEKQSICTMTNWDVYLVPSEFLDALRPPHTFAFALKCTDSLEMFENVDQAIWYLSCKTGQEAETWYSWLFDARSRNFMSARAKPAILPAGSTLLGNLSAGVNDQPFVQGAMLSNLSAEEKARAELARRSIMKANLDLSGASEQRSSIGGRTRAPVVR